MNGRLVGRVAIVTGGGKGIGVHYVRGLAEQGARVVAADVDASAAVSTAERLRAEGLEVLGVGVDVADPSSVEAMVEQTVQRFGRLDILVNNAALFTALFPRRPFYELEPEWWDRVMAVNVKGVFLCCRAAFPHLKESGSGRIVNVSSDTVLSGIPGFLHYVSSKGAVLALTRALARELGEFDITVNAIAPGLTASDSALAVQPQSEIEARAQARALKRVQVPEDLVGTLVFLASDEAAFITGQTLVVNGGFVMS